ncbi:MAG: hypothetical protein Q4B26_10105 [Eubacteriales bacterium]|nr:hypothetical protein [Eubacteriales bacterium]
MTLHELYVKGAISNKTSIVVKRPGHFVQVGTYICDRVQNHIKKEIDWYEWRDTPEGGTIIVRFKKGGEDDE